jgi:hypothetical protein
MTWGDIKLYFQSFSTTCCGWRGHTGRLRVSGWGRCWLLFWLIPDTSRWVSQRRNTNARHVSTVYLYIRNPLCTNIRSEIGECFRWRTGCVTVIIVIIPIVVLWILIFCNLVSRYWQFWAIRFLSLRSTQPSIKWVPGALSPGVKRTGREVELSLPTSAEVKKMWIHTSTPIRSIA